MWKEIIRKVSERCISVFIQDRSQQARQNRDHTFQLVPYGKTVYIGQSVREREIIVSRVFDICILVEGEFFRAIPKQMEGGSTDWDFLLIHPPSP